MFVIRVKLLRLRPLSVLQRRQLATLCVVHPAESINFKKITRGSNGPGLVVDTKPNTKCVSDPPIHCMAWHMAETPCLAVPLEIEF